MAVRDLGYRAYEGERRPASQNLWVLLRYGLFTIWGSNVVKVMSILGVLGSVGAAVVLGAVIWIAWSFGNTEPLQVFDAAPPGYILADVLGWQVVITAFAITLAAGATIIAKDQRDKAFMFYFAKPVTAEQYLLGRVLALAAYLVALLVVPLLAMVGLMVAVGGDRAVEYAGLFFPMLFQATIAAFTLTGLSIGISSLSKSQALTISVWAMVFFIPEVLTALVRLATESDWPMLASIIGLLRLTSTALFRVAPELYRVQPDEAGPEWYHAAILLALLVAGGVGLALTRLRRAEVIT